MIGELKKLGLIGVLLYPSLLLFLIPGISYWFFGYATQAYDVRYYEAVKKRMSRDKEMPAAQKADYLTDLAEHPLSEKMVSSDPAVQEIIRASPNHVQAYYLSLRWLRRLAFVAVITGLLIYPLTWLFVMLSMISPRVQYLSLLVNWHVIRGFLTLQVLIQGTLMVGLSFWVTSTFAQVYEPRLILLTTCLAIFIALKVISVVLKRADQRPSLDGVVLKRDVSARLWEKLDQLAARLGTAPPDQIVLGIDEMFYVTQQDFTLNGREYRGRTLSMSLTMLKIMSEDESSAVLTHELAHFSGADTVYGLKIRPTLIRYGNYLEVLAQSVLTRPLWRCALLFRIMFEFSLKKMSRRREFRADRIAAELVSPLAVMNSLLRIETYSIYWNKVQIELFKSDIMHHELKIMDRIEAGYYSSAPRLIEQHGLLNECGTHPYDSHPALHERLAALKVTFDPDSAARTLSRQGDGHWYGLIDDAEKIETELWKEHESMFSHAHEKKVAFQVVPETDEERALVLRHFPERILKGSWSNQALLDYEKIDCDRWYRPVQLLDIVELSVKTEWGIRILVIRDDRMTVEFKLSRKTVEQEEVIRLLPHYIRRAVYGSKYQAHKKMSQKNQDDEDINTNHEYED